MILYNIITVKSKVLVECKYRKQTVKIKENLILLTKISVLGFCVIYPDDGQNSATVGISV